MAVKLYRVPAKKYMESLVVIFKTYLQHKNVIYVSANNPYTQIKSSFLKEKIDTRDIFFIDCVSRAHGVDNAEVSECLLLNDPTDLNILGIAIHQALENLFEGEKILFLDSISSLMVQNDSSHLEKFLYYLVNKLKIEQVESILLYLDIDEDKEIVNRLCSICDEVVELTTPQREKVRKLVGLLSED
jgi:Trp operon repressor